MESTKKYSIVDQETGEVIAETAMFIGKKPYLDKGWRKIFVGFLSDVVVNEKIAGKAIRLLLWMIGELRYNSLEVYMNERVVCEELGIKRATYYNWVKALIEAKLIEKVDTNLYRLVPYSATYGHTQKAVEKDHKRRNKTKKTQEMHQNLTK